MSYYLIQQHIDTRMPAQVNNRP